MQFSLLPLRPLLLCGQFIVLIIYLSNTEVNYHSQLVWRNTPVIAISHRNFRPNFKKQ